MPGLELLNLLFTPVEEREILEGEFYPLSGFALQFVSAVQVIRIHSGVGGRHYIPLPFVFAADRVATRVRRHGAHLILN